MEFSNHERELWSGKKVRKYCIPPSEAQTGAGDGGEGGSAGSEREGGGPIGLGFGSSQDQLTASSSSTTATTALSEPLPSSTAIYQSPLLTNLPWIQASPAAKHAISRLQYVDKEEVCPTLPTGYDYADFDRVCGYARGHIGWGAPHSMILPYLTDAHSIPARLKAENDPIFDLNRGRHDVM